MRAFAKLEALAPGAQRERSWYKSCARAMRFWQSSFLHDTGGIWAPLYPLLSFELILKAGRVISWEDG